jgi:hypothetical protein
VPGEVDAVLIEGTGTLAADSDVAELGTAIPEGACAGVAVGVAIPATSEAGRTFGASTTGCAAAFCDDGAGMLPTS